MASTPRRRDPRQVFVVHGRDTKDTYLTVKEAIESLGLTAVDYDAVRHRHPKMSPYVYDVVEEGYFTSAAIVVILAPEDQACLRPELREDDPDDHRRRLQPRPNVMLETGIAMGLQKGDVIYVLCKGAYVPSDLRGKHRVDLTSKKRALRKDLASKLRIAGCHIPRDVLRRLGLPKELEEPDGNLVADWDFSRSALAAKWSVSEGPGERGDRRYYTLRPHLVCKPVRSGAHSVRCHLPAEPRADNREWWSGLAQSVGVRQRRPQALVARAWCRAREVAGDPSRNFALCVDAYYYGAEHVSIPKCEPFDTGTHDWQYKSVFVEPTECIERASVSLVLRGPQHSGRVWFDCVSLVELE